MSMFIAVLGVVLAVGTVAYFIFGKRHPQNASGTPGHDGETTSASRQFFGDKNDRPGGPGSEAEGVVGPGMLAPGPSAEAGGANDPAWVRPQDDR
jgi:hypothetical protein